MHLYNNEHMFPDLRQYAADALPPRPLPNISFSRPANTSKPASTPIKSPAELATSNPAKPATQAAGKTTPSRSTPVSHSTPATALAPSSPCTTVHRLTEADLARVSDLARDAWRDASRDARPMLWHVRRHAYERVCSRMDLTGPGVRSLLWVASERGDAWGSLAALEAADPTGLCLPPELRTPYRVWCVMSKLTDSLVFYTLGEEALDVVMVATCRCDAYLRR